MVHRLNGKSVIDHNTPELLPAVGNIAFTEAYRIKKNYNTKMYVPGASTKYCYYCGRANHLANACRYRNIDLAKITRDPQTKQLKKHFNRKPNAPKEEDRNVKPIATSSNNTKYKHESSNEKKNDQIPPSFNANKQDKRPVKVAKSLSTSSSKSSNPSDYMRCKDCIKWQMRLHQQADQANY